MNSLVRISSLFSFRLRKNSVIKASDFQVIYECSNTVVDLAFAGHERMLYKVIGLVFCRP